MFSASPRTVEASNPVTPGLSFLLPGLSFWHADCGAEDTGAPDEATDGEQGDDATDSDPGSIEPDVAAALKDVPASTDRKSEEAAVARVLPHQRWSRAAAEAFEKPLETGTTKAKEKVSPGPENKSLEVVVSQHPSQQRPLSGCPRGSQAPAKALEEPVVPATAEGKTKVHLGPDKWSTEAAVCSSPAAEEASKSEDVAAAAMGAMVPQGPLQRQPITLPKLTMQDFREAFDELLHASGEKKIVLGEGSEGIVNAVLHKQTGILRAVKWCKRATEAEVHILSRLARTRGLGRLIGCMFRRTVVKHGALRGSWRPQSTRQEGSGSFFLGGGRASRNHMDVRFLSSARQRIGRTRGVGGQRPIGQARQLPADASQALI